MVGVHRLQRGERRQLRAADADRLEAATHAAGGRQAGDIDLDLRRLRRVGRHQPRGALDDAEAPQELALRDRAVAGKAARPHRRREGGEIHLRGEVGFAGRLQGISMAMGLHRLQRVAEAGSCVAVVDEEGREGRAERRQFVGEAGQCRRALLEDVAVAGLRRAGGQLQAGDAGRRRRMPDCPPDRGRRSAPATPRAEHPLRGRQRVEELVGDDDRRAGAGEDVGAPAQRYVIAAQRRPLDGFERGVALDELDAERGAKRGNETRRAQRIAHQRAAPGPELDRAARPAAMPICCQTTAHHRPISSPNTWLISGAVTKSPARPMAACRAVIAVLGVLQAGLHVLVDADRAVAARCARRACCARGVARARPFAVHLRSRVRASVAR